MTITDNMAVTKLLQRPSRSFPSIPWQLVQYLQLKLSSSQRVLGTNIHNTHGAGTVFRGTFSLAHQQTSWQADHELDARVGAAYK